MDAAVYRAQRATGYTRAQLEEEDADFIVHHLMCHAADNEAQRIQQERDMAAAKHRPG